MRDDAQLRCTSITFESSCIGCRGPDSSWLRGVRYENIRRIGLIWRCLSRNSPSMANAFPGLMKVFSGGQGAEILAYAGWSVAPGLGMLTNQQLLTGDYQ